MHSTKKRKPNEPIAINSPSYSPTSPESDVEPSSAESKPHNSKAIDREDIDLRFPNELNGAIKDESDTSDDEILIITEETSNSAQNHDNGLFILNEESKKDDRHITSEEIYRLLKSEDLKDRQRGLDETIKQFSQYRKDNIQLRNRLTRSFENTERNEAELDTQKIQLRQKSEEIAMLQDKIKSCKTDLDSLNGELTEAQMDKGMRQQEIEKLRQENQRLTNSYSIPSEDWSRLKDELQRQNVTVEKYQKTIEADRLLHKSQMVKIRDEYQRELSCVVCLDKRRDTTFLPCCHLICCKKCAESQKNCGICRGNIMGKITAFLS